MNLSQNIAPIALTIISLIIASPIQAETKGTELPAPAPQGGRFVAPENMLPPIPLSTAREKQILQAVFSRFPGEDPSEVMAYLRTHFPQKIRYFTVLSMRDVDPAVEYLTEVVRDCTELLRTQVSDPKRHEKLLRYQKLESQAYQQGEQLRRAKGDSRSQLQAELAQTLDAGFMIKQDLMRQELADMEAELRMLRNLIQKREDNRKSLVNRRIAQITGDSDLLEW
jgi:hypothetical protein